MELRQVEHFLAVARNGSFTVAAQDAHIVQSALSASIRKLEAELGAPLFERTTRQVMLTEAGRALLPAANRLVADVVAARGEVSAVVGLSRGRVSIGTIQALSVIDLPSQLGVFQKRHPGIQIHVRDGTVPELTAAVHNGELDLAYWRPTGLRRRIWRASFGGNSAWCWSLIRGTDLNTGALSAWRRSTTNRSWISSGAE